MSCIKIQFQNNNAYSSGWSCASKGRLGTLRLVLLLQLEEKNYFKICLNLYCAVQQIFYYAYVCINMYKAHLKGLITLM